jgi:hypothetical protein
MDRAEAEQGSNDLKLVVIVVCPTSPSSTSLGSAPNLPSSTSHADLRRRPQAPPLPSARSPPPGWCREGEGATAGLGSVREEVRRL